MKKRDLSLDILRVLSCTMVFCVHFGEIPGIIGRFMAHGSTGVDFFFILSGFLSYFSLSNTFKNSDLTFNSIRNYWIKRSTRILPLYYLIVLLYIVFYSIKKEIPVDPTGLYWIRYFLFLNLWIPTESYGFWMNLGALWSISVFVLFYLLVPFFYKIVRNYYSAWIGVIISFGILKLADLTGYDHIPIRFMFYFFLGILLKVAIDEHAEHRLFGIFTLFLLFLVLTEQGLSLVPQLIVSLYILGTRGSFEIVSEKNILYRIITFLSTISYSVYLNHIFIMHLLGTFGITNRLLWVILTLIVSTITYYFIENKLGKTIESALISRFVKTTSES